ncbi:MAG TPA: tyrosine-type recombinase/integrase [Candidatus Acidoferrum sp.]
MTEVVETKKRERGSGRIYRRGNALWICYYDADGRQRRESVSPAIEAERQKGKKVINEWKVAEQLLSKQVGAKLNDILPSPKKSRVTVGKLYDDEVAYLLTKGKPKTAAWLKSRWDGRLKEAFGARRAREIRLADLTAYQLQRMEYYWKRFPDATQKKISACETAVNGDLAALRMMFYRGKRQEKIDVVPTFPEQFIGAGEREGTVNEEQFQSMLDACGPDELWLRTFLTMAYNWGYRLRELLNLQVIRVNFRERTVYLPPRSTKNKKPRMVPISEEEVPLLLGCVEGKSPEDFVFTRKDGKRVLDFRIRWEQLVSEAKAGHAEIDLSGKQTWVPAIPHDLRRTAVSQMLSGGMPPEAVRSLVGHLSKEMTERYYKPAIETLRRLQRDAKANLAILAKDGEIPENRRLTKVHSSCTIATNLETEGKQAL